MKLWAERVTPAFAKATQNTDQTIPDSDTTQIDLDSAEDEKQGYLVVNTSQNQITVLRDGIYYIEAMVTYAEDTDWSTGDVAAVNIVANGSTIEAGEQLKIGTGKERGKTTHVGLLGKGDVISASAFQNSGLSQSTDSGGTAPRVYLSVARLGDQP